MKENVKHKFILMVTMLLAPLSVTHAADKLHRKPNIILILANDLGYGDLGCYGSEVNNTPHLDALAKGGLRFTDFHSAGAMCSPTRASILTGRYPQRFGRMFDGALSSTTQGHLGLPLEATTVAEALSRNGYATGCFGKWHLGYRVPLLPTRQGFDLFRGLVSGDGDFHTHIDRSGNKDWWHNDRIEMAEGYTTDLLTKYSVDFIEAQRENPFFLYLPHLAIHFPWQGPDDPPHRTAGKSWHKDKWGVIPDRGNVAPHVKAMIESLDTSVGAIVAVLRKWDLENNTVIVFTSDNGGYLTYGKDFRNISSNGPCRGQKTELYEGGHRVPMIVSWPGRIPPGVTHEVGHSNDLFPTLLSLCGSGPVESDGVDLAPLWLEGKPLPKRDLYWRTRSHRAVRSGPWKLVTSLRNGGKPELYHLGNDPGETTNVAATETQRVKALQRDWRGWNAKMALNEESNDAVMLAGDWVPDDPHQIDYEKLPRVKAEHAIISDVRDHAGTRVHQHAYLAHHDGRFWAMWSDGPGGPRAGATPEQHRNIVPAHDMPGTRNSFATSKDGLHWSKPADLTGPPRKKGYGWIARGLWKRDGELLALSSHFDAPGYEGLGLSLEAFRWNGTKWVAHGTVLDDSMNNFPPKRLPSGEWMMTRRDHRRQVSVMIGGTKAFDDWRINPLAAYDGNGRPEEPYWYILPDGKTIVGLIRDNGRSKFLLRTFSRDNGKTWSKMHRTNFPDATSKFFVHRTSRGYYVMVSNSNPRKRDPLTLAISKDGLVYTKLFWLIGERHVDYPHIIEHDGHLLIAFSGAKQTMEVMKVSLDELERLTMPESVELAQHLPPVKQTQKPPRHWIDLGDEGKTLYAVADLVVPELSQQVSFSLATASGTKRIVIGIDENGRLTAQLYKETVTGRTLEPGSRHAVLLRVHSHRRKPDELFVELGTSGKIPAEPDHWTLSNTKGRSDANLSRVILHSDADDSAGFENVRIAATHEGLATANVIAEGVGAATAEPDFEAVLKRFRSGTVTLPDGRSMKCHRRTGDGPLLVLIPGTWGDLQSFAPLLAELPGDMPVTVVELCWQGGLVPKRTDLSIEELADDVLHVVNKLNLSNFFISGHSIGGMITVEIAGRNIHGLQGAIPMEGWTHYSVPQKAFAGVVTAGLSPEQQVRRNRDRARGRGHLNTEQLRAIGSIWQRWNGAASLKRSRVPILHVWGDRGRPRPDRSKLQIPERPEIEIAWIRDASHAVILQAPKAVAAAIAAFMKHHAPHGPAAVE